MSERDSGWRSLDQEGRQGANWAAQCRCLSFHQWTSADWQEAMSSRASRLLGVAPLMTLLPADASVPQAVVRTPVLDADPRWRECWTSDRPVVAGQHGVWRFRRNDHVLFGALSLREADFAPPAAAAGSEPDTGLRRATEVAYSQLFRLLEGEGFPHLLRIWNYLPAINAVDCGLERYRQFNIGRQDAFLAHARPHAEGAPAACALGTQDGELTIYFLAGRQPVVPIENPRQVSAYHYPSRYGPRAPTFSRAALARLPGQEVLFVSGTASIVGHQTLHVGDVAAQTREALTNIEVVVEQANRVAAQHFGLDDLICKVYVRHPADYATVRSVMETILRPRVPPVFVQADICRDDLLVEIEATAFAALED